MFFRSFIEESRIPHAQLTTMVTFTGVRLPATIMENGEFVSESISLVRSWF